MIIGLVGAKHSGKSTVFADYLVTNYKFNVIAHSDPIKNMLRALGLTEEQINGSLKEEPCDLLCGNTPRYAMQTLGSEWGRRLIHPDLWVHLWGLESGNHNNVVADGVRFANEVYKIKELGGITIKIRRPTVEGRSNHDTEMYASSLKTDYEIFNREDDQEQGIKELEDILSQYKI